MIVGGAPRSSYLTHHSVRISSWKMKANYTLAAMRTLLLLDETFVGNLLSWSTDINLHQHAHNLQNKTDLGADASSCCRIHMHLQHASRTLALPSVAGNVLSGSLQGTAPAMEGRSPRV